MESENSEILSENEPLENLTSDQLIKIILEKRTSEETHFSGPLPPPEMLEQYNKGVPDAANRILVMAEKQAEHRRYCEKKQVDTESRDSLLGILSALIVSIVILITGTVIVIVAGGVVGTIAGTLLNLTGIATIIGTFLRGTGNSWKNKE